MSEQQTITRKDAIELLQISTKAWNHIKETLSEVKKGVYLLSDITELSKNQADFINNHMDIEEVRNIFKGPKIRTFKTVKVPHYANTGKFKGSRTAFNKLDMLDYINQGEAKDEHYINNNICIDAFKEFKDISFDEFCNDYYNFEEINSLLTQKERNKAPSITVPYHFRKGKFETKISAYKKVIIDERKNAILIDSIPFMDQDISNYLSISESAELVGATPQIWADIRKELNMSTFRSQKNNNFYVLRTDTESFIENYNSFYKEHCTYEDATELLAYPHFDNLKRMDLPIEFRIKDFYKKKYCYSREEINLKIKDGFGKVSINTNDYYHWTEIEDLLNISTLIFKRACNQFGFDSVTYEGKVYYKKTDINLLKKYNDDFSNKHLTSLEIQDTYNHCYQSLETQQFKVNIPDWQKFGKFTQADYAYKKEDFLTFLSIKKDYDTFLEPFYSKDVLNEFRKKLEIYPYFKYKDLQKSYPFATKLLHDFFDSKLLNTGASPKSLNSLVRETVRAFGAIFDLIKEHNRKDIHMVQTSEILLFCNKLNSSTLVTTHILPFLKYTHTQITRNMDKNSVNKKIFNIDTITKLLTPDIERKELLNADIYDIETFLEMIYYCRNTELHIKNVIDEINDLGTVYYASYWLFSTINLNNPWRKGDISCFPSLDINDILDHIGIYDIDWFLTNSLSLEQSRLILSRLYGHQYVVSKTKEYNELFVSNDLSPSVATCIAILTLHRNKLSITEHNYIMSFYTEFNYPSDHSFNKFFKNFKVDGFEFKSNKTGSTLMTFIQAIKTGDSGEEMLKLANNLRAHADLMATLNYIKLNPETLNTLSSNLFKRGEFGYIYCAIANKLGLHTNTLKELDTIDPANILRDTIDSPFDIEVISSKLNIYEKNTTDILKQINRMEFKQIQEKFASLALKESPSNEKDIQCFIGADNCPYKNTTKKVTCAICHNGIPTLYALNSIAKELVHLLIKDQQTTLLGEKFKLSNAISHYKARILEAIKEYGHDLVYTYIQLDRKDFRYLIECVEDIDDLIERNIYHIC